MGLDKTTQALLDSLAEQGGGGLHELSLEDARNALLGMTLELDIPRTELADVRNLDIPVGDGRIQLRIYLPEGAGGAPLPILMVFHGGGFALGDLETHDNLCRYYAKEAGAVVVAVHYRRSPEHKFPAAPEDCYAALCWAAENAASFGGDPARVAVTGDSAGGNLSAVVCQLAKTRGGPKISFQALVYPAVNMDRSKGHPSRQAFGQGEYFLSLEDFEWLNGMYFSDEAAEVKDLRASPILEQNLNDLPPALVITAGFDPLVDEGKEYADRLAAAGVPTEYKCFEGTIHGFMSFAGALDAGKEGLALVASCLREAFGGER